MPPKSFSDLGAIGGGSAKAAPSAASSAASSAAHPAAPASSAPTKTSSAAASAAAHPAPPKACAEFNKNKTPCGRGQNCWDERCRNASKATAAASPKSSRKGGDGGVAAQLAAMEKRFFDRLDGIESKIDSGFDEQRKLSLELQAQGSKSYAETMNMFKMFGQMVTGGFAAIQTSRPELPAPSANRAICASSSRSNVTEMHDEPRFTRGGSGSSERSVESGLTGSDIDPFMQACVTSGFLEKGMLFQAICNICGKTGLSDYHRELISSIGKVTSCDNLATLLFLLLTGSKQFRKASFVDFRKNCDTMLGSNLANTRTTFSNVCDNMLKSMADWQIVKKGGISVSNGDLKDKSKRESVFDTLVRNFQS